MDVLRCGDVHPNPGPPSQQVLRVVSWNCRAVGKRVDILALQASRRALDVIALQETQLRPGEDAPRLQGYRSFRRDRTAPRTADGVVRGGGLLTYVRDTLVAEAVSFTMPATDTVTERLDVRVWTAGNPVVVSNLYLPPAPTGPEDIRPPNYLTEGSLPTGNHVFVCGDLNAHHPDWGGPGTTSDHRGRTVAAWLRNADYQVWNEVGVKTWTSGGRTSTIDLVLSADAHDSSSWCALGSWGSDHSPLYFEVPCDDPKRASRPPSTWNFERADWDTYVKHVEKRLLPLRNSPDVDRFAGGVAKVLTDIAEQLIPRCGGLVNKHPWWNDEVASVFDERDSLRESILRGLSSDHQALRELDRAAENAIIAAKREKWADLCDGFSRSKNLGAAFRAVKHLDGRSQRHPLPVLVDGNTPLVSDRCKADRLGQYYASMGSKRSAPGASVLPPASTPSGLGCEPFTLSELDRQLAKVKARSAAGDDGVFNVMLQHLGEDGRRVLLELFNLSFSTGRFPNVWRSSLVIPVLKQGKDPTLVSSYRPISLTSCVCKLLERMIEARMTFLMDCPASGVEGLHSSQAGFRAGRSTEEHVAAVVQEISDRWAEGKTCLVLLFDLSRAFDRVCHDSLVAKMKAKGFPEMYTRWISAFLKGRTAKVRVGAVQGSRYKVRSGVPQGSVLGPVLFTLYLDDLARLLSDLADLGVVYADDVAAVVSGKTREELRQRAQAVLDLVEAWCEKWGMLLSTEKTKALIFGPRQDVVLHFRSSRRTHPVGDFTGVTFEDGTPIVKLDPAGALTGRLLVAVNGESVPLNTTAIGARLLGGDVTNVETATPLHPSATAKYLGVLLDTSLAFTQHAADLKVRYEQRLRVLKLLAGTRWGCKTDSLRALYRSYVLPVLTYCLGVYFVYLPLSVREELAALHREASLLISGCADGSSPKAVLVEAGLLPLGIMASYTSCVLLQRSLRWPDTPIGRIVGDGVARRSGWMVSAQNISRQAGLGGLVPERLDGVACPPWGGGVVEFFDTTPTPVTKGDPDDVRRAAGVEAIQRCPAGALEVYTDGSVRNGNGGAGLYVVHPDDAVAPVTYAEGAGPFCYSYRAELCAINEAMRVTLEMAVTAPETCPSALNIFTDSQSCVRGLAGGPAASREELFRLVWRKLWLLTCCMGVRVTLQYLPSHCGIEGNEKADGVAGDAVHLLSNSVDLKSAKARLKAWAREAWGKVYRDKPPERHCEVTGAVPPKYPAAMNRRDEVIITRLRVGQTALTRGYLQLAGPNRARRSHQLACPACEIFPMDRDHLLRTCPNLVHRAASFYNVDLPLPTLLVEYPQKVVDYLRLTGLLEWSRTGQFAWDDNPPASPPPVLSPPALQIDLFRA